MTPRRSALCLAVAASCASVTALAQEAPPSLPAATEDAPAPTAAGKTRAAVLPVFADGVDARAAQAASEQLAASLAAFGYDVVPEAEMGPAFSAVTSTRATSASELWTATHLARARLGLTGTLRAEEGRYVLELVMADTSGAGPFRTQVRSDGPGLRLATENALQRVLALATTPEPRPAPAPIPPIAPVQPAALVPVTAPPPEPVKPPVPFSRLHLAAQTEAAIGLTGDGFYNHLAGGRLDYRATRDVAVGGYLGYANLKGKDGRAHNLLSYALVEYRVPLDGARTWQIPLRVAPGYLPKNGPVLRLSAGVAVHVADDVDLVFDLLAPMLWLTGDLTVASLNFAAEVGWDLPRAAPR